MEQTVLMLSIPWKLHESSRQMKRPCVFFDRDGIINTAPPPEEYYVLSPDRFFIEPGFVQALRLVVSRGWAAAVVTNQKCVARGLITLEELDCIHEVLRTRLRTEHVPVPPIYICPHGNDDHPDRKPNPGMLIRAADEMDLDLVRSWMIGDSERDITAGRRAGCAVTVKVDASGAPTEATCLLKTVDELADLLKQKLPDTGSPA